MNISGDLFEALGKIDRTGTFCSYGSLPPVLPGLEIDGIGPIAFPLTAEQAKQIQKHCQQAPYGKGEQTIIDTSVRQVWRMPPDLFQLVNPDWEVFLAQTLSKVALELGLEGQKLNGHLHDLLLYEKGSFFLPHQDGEKLNGMVATLVVVLPSSFQGGELIVRHEGHEETIDFGAVANSNFLTHFAAFYADCEHEVRPLHSGYRLSLVYNLTLEKSKKTITAPRNIEHIRAVADILRIWSGGSDDSAQSISPVKLAIPLEHKYTQDGLSWETLKGVDRTRAAVLREASRQSSCKVHLAQLIFWEQGYAPDYEENYRGYGRGRWYEHYYGDDEDDQDDKNEEAEGDDNDQQSSGSSYEMEEVFDSSLTGEHWMDDEGHRLEFEPMAVLESEVVPQGAIKKVSPEEDFEGYTGNAGMTLERWYRHGAIFIWPEQHHFQVLCDCGINSATAALNQMVNNWLQAGKTEAAGLKSQCLELAYEIVAQWQPTSHVDPDDELEPSQIVTALAQLNDVKLIKVFLSKVMPQDSSVALSIPLLQVCERLGWSNFNKEFATIFEHTTAASLGRNVRLLEQICSNELPKSAERCELASVLASHFVAALIAIDKEKDDWQTINWNRVPMLILLIKALISAEQSKILASLTAHVLKTPKRYKVASDLVDVLLGLKDWLPGHIKRPCTVSNLIAACCSELEQSTAQMPQKPVDFSRSANISCRCGDCKELIEFLKDPKESVCGFKVKKSRRQHLHQVIEKHQCDVSHVTERSGSPQTLVCKKNINSFHRDLKRYKQDRTNLEAIKSIEVALAEAGANF